MADTPADQPDWRPRPDPTVLTTEALHREIERLQEILGMRIDSVVEVAEQRFRAIDHRFDGVESARVEHKADTQSAVNAALTAQKEAVIKSELAIARQVEQLAGTVTVAVEGLRRDSDDLKARIGTMEAKSVGGKEVTTERRESNAAVYALASFVLALLLIGGIVLATLPP